MSLKDLKAEMTAKKNEIEASVAPRIREAAKRHGLDARGYG